MNTLYLIYLIYAKTKVWKWHIVVLQEGYMRDYFLAGCSHFLESLLVAWQLHREDKTPAKMSVEYSPIFNGRTWEWCRACHLTLPKCQTIPLNIDIFWFALRGKDPYDSCFGNTAVWTRFLITNPDTTFSYFPPSVEAKWAYNEAALLPGLSIGLQAAPRSLIKMWMHNIWVFWTADGNRKQAIIRKGSHFIFSSKNKNNT